MKIAFALLLTMLPLFALEPGIPVQSGSSILVPLVPSDQPNRTVLLVTTYEPSVSRFIVQFTVNGTLQTRVAERTPGLPQSFATIIVEAPLAELKNLTVEGAVPGKKDPF